MRDADDEEKDWVEVERRPVGNEPMTATGLVWAAGAVWIAGDLDLAYDGDVWQAPRRAVLLSNVPGNAPPVVLPSVWELQVERRKALGKPAEPGTGEPEE